MNPQSWSFAPDKLGPTSLKVALTHEPTRDEVFRQSSARALRAVRASIGRHVVRHFDSEDAVQEAWVSILASGRSLASIDADDVVRMVLAISNYRVRSAARRAARFGHVDHFTESWEARAREPAHEEAAGNRRRRVRASLAALSLRHRQVLVMRHWLDVPWETIALVLGCKTLHAAQSFHSRAMQALGRELRRSGAPDA